MEGWRVPRGIGIAETCYHNSRDFEHPGAVFAIFQDIEILGLFDDLVITNQGMLRNPGDNVYAFSHIMNLLEIV